MVKYVEQLRRRRVLQVRRKASLVYRSLLLYRYTMTYRCLHVPCCRSFPIIVLGRGRDAAPTALQLAEFVIALFRFRCGRISTAIGLVTNVAST